MSMPPGPPSPRRLFVSCVLLLGLALAAVGLEGRSPAVLPLLAVAGCLVFHWFGHGRRATQAAGDKSGPAQGLRG
jgi:hypothetical protein